MAALSHEALGSQNWRDAIDPVRTPVTGCRKISIG
jgi:hypothetical protein